MMFPHISMPPLNSVVWVYGRKCYGIFRGISFAHKGYPYAIQVNPNEWVYLTIEAFRSVDSDG